MAENPVNRLYDALARGDVAGARACFTPEAQFGIVSMVSLRTLIWP